MTKRAHIEEFDKNAHSYAKYNIIQTQVAKELISKVTKKPKKIIDLGCGEGAIYRLIDWQVDEFIAVDKSTQMLTLHPDKGVQKIASSIEEFDYETYSNHFYISSSAMQWCEDLDCVFQSLQNKKFALALFSANTFKTIHQSANSTSPVATKEKILEAMNKNFKDIAYEIREYRLFFDSTMQMLQYIKNSGVSGGNNLLSYTQTKRILTTYAKNYLEFEVIFISN